MSRGHLSAVLVVFACMSCSVAQEQAKVDQPTATVVFFTPGGHWRGAMSQLKKPFGTSDIESEGTLFDGKDSIAYLSHSRYLVLRMSPGPHVLSATLHGFKPSEKQAVTLDLLANSVTYLALTMTITHYVPGYVASRVSHVAQAKCADFEDDHETNNSEPVAVNQVSKEYQAQAAESIQPPPCTP